MFTKQEIGVGATQFTWDPITGALSDTPVELKGSRPLAGCVQVISGTPGTFALEGSNDGTNWSPLKNLQGTVIALGSLTAMEEFTTSARFIRPLGNAGSIAAVCRVLVRG